jgi:hypothetical protein
MQATGVKYMYFKYMYGHQHAASGAYLLQFYYALEGAIKSKNPSVLNDTKSGAPYQVLQALARGHRSCLRTLAVDSCATSDSMALQVLKAFLTGINGGGLGTRSQYAFDNLNIPAVSGE